MTSANILLAVGMVLGLASFVTALLSPITSRLGFYGMWLLAMAAMLCLILSVEPLAK